MDEPRKTEAEAGEAIRIGVSSCLLGNGVRYDGGHKHDRWITDVLGRYVAFVPVCPEVECGLGTPRESMHLEGDPADPRLLTTRTRKDLTDRMKAWCRERLEQLEKEDLCGYIFKSKSPSSGLFRVKVYGPPGTPPKMGSGLFAKAFVDRFPHLPVEEEGRLHDADLRENFIERLFAMKRWRGVLAGDRTPGALQEFHTRHKMLILSHSQALYRDLGKRIATVTRKTLAEDFRTYEELFLQALGLKATPTKHVNVIMHMMGYFKKQLSPDEKQELLELIGNYRSGNLPLIVPLTLMGHYVRKYDQPYLKNQVYLNPHPLELKLRNHV
jgi:uncharacterized protein YbgA (DUF1722 family)/uncharacterized protein YbbK (DUF523 family)